MFLRRLLPGLAPLLLLLTVPARPTPPTYPDILPLNRVHAGMKGYGLTVFRGTKIERFGVTIVDVVRKGSLVAPGHDVILVRLSGGPMTKRGAFMIRGMSGSPIYIGGKIIGAYSQAEPTTKEPLGGVTPIEDMLDAWDPSLPARPYASLPGRAPTEMRLARPIVCGGRTITRIVANAPAGDARRSHGETLVLQRCTSVLPVAGLSPAVRARLAAALAPYDVEVRTAAAGAGGSTFRGTALVPGAAVSVLLVSGDNPLPATGTVTYRQGNRILAFGHPFLGLGPVEAPMSSAYVHDIYALQSGSYKIASPGPVVGATLQDRPFSISGALGRQPRTVPVTIDALDKATGRRRQYHSEAVQHPSLTPALVSVAVDAAVSDVRDTPGVGMATIVTTVDAEEVGRITRTNTVFDARDVAGACTADLDEIAAVLAGSPFGPVNMKSVRVAVEMETARRTATIERAFVRKARYEPGDTVDVGVVLRPYRQAPVTRTLRVAIPRGVPSGRLSLIVRGGGATTYSIGGLVVRTQPGAPEQAPPTSTRQMLDRLLERERGNELSARLVLPGTSINVDGERLSDLPPTLDAVLRSARSSNVRLDRDDVRAVQPTDWVVYGQQTLTLNVQRPDDQEHPSAAGGAAAPASASPAPAPSAAAVVNIDPDDAAVMATAAATVHGPRTRTVTAEPGVPGSPKQTAPTAAAGAPVPAPTPTSAATVETPVGRAAETWKQTARADFARGTLHGVAVNSSGELRLTRAMARIASAPDTYAWSLASAPDGGVYVGTGAPCRILHVSAKGDTREIAKLPEVAVHALLVMPDGALIAATGPHGRTYRVSPDGRATVFHQAVERYALALARDGAGAVYVGVGGGAAAVYRIAPDGKAARLCGLPQGHVLALAVEPSGGVLAGTAPDGVVYRITPGGKDTVVADSAQQSVVGVAPGPAGAVYYATAPQGAIYRAAADGTSRQIYTRPVGAMTSLCGGPDGRLYAAGGNDVYEIAPDDTVTPLDVDVNADILAIAAGDDGSLFAATGNCADVYAAPAQAPRAGEYTSAVHDARDVAQWGSLRLGATVPPGASVEALTRSGRCAEPDPSWSAWEPVRPAEAGPRVGSPAARFVQLRLRLKAEAGSGPSVREIAVACLPANRPPHVAFQAPVGGEKWAAAQTIRWEASDPDRDTLRYEVEVTGDNGSTWKPLPGATPPTAATPAPATAAPAAKPRDAVGEVQAELAKHPGVPSALREAIMERARQIEAERSGKPPPTAAPQAAAPSAAPPQGTARAFDTSLLPDGTYRLRVTASDRPSNATGWLTAQAVSEPFVVCNARPSVFVVDKKVEDDRTVTVEAIALQRTTTIAAAQFRVDGGEWLAAAPADGLFDSDMERFQCQTGPLAAGKHRIEVKVFSSAGLTAADTVDVEAR